MERKKSFLTRSDPFGHIHHLRLCRHQVHQGHGHALGRLRVPPRGILG